MSLSCDPVQERYTPVKFCEHGRFPLTCEWCLIVDMQKEIIELRNRIESLHEFKLKQIDENRKVSNKLDELIRDSKLYAHPLQAKIWQENIIERLERVEKFDGCNNDIFSNHMDRFDKLENEIKELKRFQDITHLQYQNNINKRQPFVCPRCNDLTECDMCNSTGIVWG